MSKQTSKDVVQVSSGIGFIGVLTIVFIILKLTDRIDWAWWLVLAPLWIPAASALLIGVIILFGILIIDRQ